MSQRGYTVTADLRDALLAELSRLRIPHRVVAEPEGLGDDERPVLVLSGPSPKGWSRYGRCRDCKGASSLTAEGLVSNRCQTCRDRREADSHRPPVTAADYWGRIERYSYHYELGLPDWAGFVGPSVADVISNLQAGKIAHVGKEREQVVADAILAWRRRVIAMLSGDLTVPFAPARPGGPNEET